MICYNETAVHLSGSKTKFDVSSGLDFLKQEKKDIQAKVKEQTSITLKKPDPTGHGEMSTMVNIAEAMLNTCNWTLLT